VSETIDERESAVVTMRMKGFVERKLATYKTVWGRGGRRRGRKMRRRKKRGRNFRGGRGCKKG
jgi:hypothetical protein